MQKPEIESLLQHPSRIKWACRRGMLELDVLLNNFLENGYSSLDDQQKHLFVEILYMQDPELYSLLMERVAAPNEETAQLIQRIRHYARS